MNINSIFSELAKYNMIIKEAETEKKRLESLIKQAMEEAGTDTLNGNEHKATYKTYAGETFDKNAFKAENPKLYECYLIETETKRFYFK